MTTIHHFSHQEHPLVLKDEVVCENKPMCYACNKLVITTVQGSAYTCATCKNFFLHKTRAELPTQINHPMHNKHSLTLLPRLLPRITCDVCRHKWEHFLYRCEDCDFDVCLLCTLQEDRAFRHISHDDHFFKLIRREALFSCDACGQEAKDSSYSCNNCDFWMHTSCASSSTTVSMPNFHRHPMQLIFAIPDMHRSSDQFCGKCKKLVRKNYWSYYCQECAYFVHIRCAALPDTMAGTKKDDNTAELRRIMTFFSCLLGCPCPSG
nr:PREDICTED: uncharacterized protein LOC108226856 [Daucus carota subsp. sativus]